jgi:hypothetical protein
MRAVNATISAESNGGACSKPYSDLVRLDQRTRLARRINGLRSIFIEALGGECGVAAVALVRIESAAHLKACAEIARSRYLSGDGAIDDVVRAENLAARAERALGIGKKAANGPSPPDLATYLATKRAETAAA